MPFAPHRWHRFPSDTLSIYLCPDRPAWFVPTAAGDRLLQRWQQGEQPCGPAEQTFAERLPAADAAPYTGRAAHLSSQHLRELWFHLTDRCNLACRHCLFASGPGDAAELAAEVVLQRAREAHALGCRVFALTGGEPLYHREFARILDGLLALEGSRVVLLTNGLLLRQQLGAMTLDTRRLFLQISVDGLGARHEAIRGRGTFAALGEQLAWLRAQQLPFTLSMCVERDNLADMPALVDFAAEVGASNVHYLWYFVRGRGAAEAFVPPEELFPQLLQAEARARQHGLAIDNIEILKTQIFAPAGTRHDGSTAGWESAAIGPDGALYPTAATVGVAELRTPLDGALATTWQQSPVLQNLRQQTAAALTDDPFRFLLGGGDLDHSYLAAGTCLGDDPYDPLHRQLALWLIAEEAAQQVDCDRPQLRLKMGDRLESCGAHGAVALTHSNCLLALAEGDSRSKVKDYYREAVGDTKEEILNPVCYAPELIAHIPPAYRYRGYGCGSPVLDARLQPGETVVDLGCGSGVECFLAAKMVGAEGRALGVDMLDPMLALAREGAVGVRQNLGYDNLEFHKGYLEELPLADDSVDCILSNCVMNLSSHKRRAFGEILRVLKPGGRLVISDVVCDSEPDAALRNDETLQGECIGGALTQKDLAALLEELGFGGIRLIKRFPYRVVLGHPFYSLTFEAVRPQPVQELVPVIYRGPLAAIGTDSGVWLKAGRVAHLPRAEAEALADMLFLLDDDGAVRNQTAVNACACAMPPEEQPEAASCCAPPTEAATHASGCLLCGEVLLYGAEEQAVRCSICGTEDHSRVTCRTGHFVCDGCHSQDAVEVITSACLATDETDMLALFNRVRAHPALKVHGPEHHALVPGVILATYRNRGGELPLATVEAGIRRGAKIAGGSCGFTGVCGAAAGVGIAFSLLLEASPVAPKPRQAVQRVVARVIDRLAQFEAARCCLRDCTLALQEAVAISRELLPVTLQADALVPCRQQAQNAECYGGCCPLA